MADPGEVEIVAGSATHEARTEHVEPFSPLAHMPKDTPKGHARFWGKLAARAKAGRSPLAAVELHCIDCCGWERTEAKGCRITTCALWQLNQRIFGGA